MKRVINVKFAEEDEQFKGACEEVGAKPTQRQASKWRNQKGSAYLKGLPLLNKKRRANEK